MSAHNDIFSKRNRSLPDVFQYDVLPDPLRAQIVFALKPLLTDTDTYTHVKSVSDSVCEEHGVFELDHREHGRLDPQSEIRACIVQSPNTSMVLDLVEQCIRMTEYIGTQRYRWDEIAKSVIDKINWRFREHGVGYEFDANSHVLIRIDSKLIHETATLPALSLLTQSQFASAEAEFVGAYVDYRHARFGDCCVKSCSAFESVLKVICDEKGWPYDPERDTCGTLVQSVISHGVMEPFLAAC